ncbi:MAG: hypothetical protein KQH83_07205 [Actinobacteria bacterium]|nr:hypothetical protein [Actinomycetota bacterium]
MDTPDGPDPQQEKSQLRHLVLDDLERQFDTFQALRKSDGAAADAVLEGLGAQGDVDRDIVLELSAPRPLGHPERFPEAHRLAVRGLEVLDRNGGRGVSVRGLGPLGPVAAFLTQQMTQFIVRSHQSNVASSMLHLYERREANAAPGDPALPLLRRARIQMQRLTPGFKKNALGVPIFVIGGALLSTILSLTQRALASALSSLWGRVIATVVIGLIMAAVAWVIVRGAAVARRRIKLSLDGPVAALWETIGRCGDPPRDPAKVFGLIGIVIALLPWVLIPTGLLVSWVTELF